MNRIAYPLVRRALLMSVASIIMTLMFTLQSFGSGLAPLSGNTEDATVQIGCGVEAQLRANPLVFTANYQNLKRTVAYDHNTSGCPITDFEGELLRGVEGSGNFQSVTIGGQTIGRNTGERLVDVQQPDGTAIIIIIDIYDYSGRLYIEITIINE